MKIASPLFMVSLALLAAVGLVGCSSGGGSGSSTLTVAEFVGADTTEFFFRDQPLVFQFTSAIDPNSVSVSGLTVRREGIVVQGRIEVDGRRITWYPVVREGERNDYTPNNNPPLNGLGFEGTTEYTVSMLGNSAFSIQSKQGRPLTSSFNATFTTSNLFTPEDSPEAPRLLLTDTSPGFSPAPLVDGDPFSSNPDDWPVVDPSTLSIQLDFSERLLPSSLDPFDTVTITNISNTSIPIPGIGSPALVDLQQGAEADTIDIECLTSLGDDPTSLDPFIFQVRLTSGVTDLSGNPLSDVVFHFKTADKPGEQNFLVITENFETTDFENTMESNARWGTGLLEGAEVAFRQQSYLPMLPRGGIPGIPPPNTFNLPHPLIEAGNPATPFGTSFMMRFNPNEVGSLEGESIVGMSWAPKSRFSFFSTYPDVVMALGHKGATPGDELFFQYGRNYDLNIPNNPSIIFQGNYSTPVDLDARWVPWPEFQQDFEYNSINDLLLFWDMPEGGDTFQLFKNDSTRSFPRNRIFSNGGDTQGRNGRENTQYETLFDLVRKSSVGVSLAYGASFNGISFREPNYEAFLVRQDPTRAGTNVAVEWAGGQAEGSAPPSQNFSSNINSADGLPACAFKVLMAANPFTSVVPSVFSVSFAVADADPPDLP